MSNGLDSLLDAVLSSCRGFLNHLFQEGNIKDHASFKEALEFFLEQRLKPAILPRVKGALSYGKYCRFCNKNTNSLDYVMLLNKLRFTAEDKSMIKLLESVQNQMTLDQKFETIKEMIPELFKNFRQCWFELFKAVLEEQLLGSKGFLSRLKRSTVPRTDSSLLHYCFDFIKSCAQQEKVDLRTKEGKALKKEKTASDVVQKRILELTQTLDAFDLNGISHLSDCTDEASLYRSLDEIGSEMEKRKKEMFVFDFDEEEMFKLRYQPKNPFSDLEVKYREFDVVEGSLAPNFSALVSVMPDSDNCRKTLLQTVLAVFDRSTYITSLHNVELSGLETTDLFSALRDSVILSSTKEDQLKNAVLKRIESADSKPAGLNGWPYPGSLEDRKKLFFLLQMGKDLPSRDAAYMIAWFGNTFNCNICVWVAGRSPPAVIFPGRNYLAQKRSNPDLDKRNGVQPKHCYHVAALGTVRGKPHQFISISKKHGHVVPETVVQSPELLAALSKERRHCLNFDTNVLLDVYREGFGEAFFDKLELYSSKIALLIPAVVWAEELDSLKNVRRRVEPRNESDRPKYEEKERVAKIARDLNKLVLSKLRGKSKFWIFQTQDNDQYYLSKFKGLRDNQDDRQVFFIRDQLIERPRSITMITKDVNLSSKCLLSEIPVLTLQRLKQLVDETEDPLILLQRISHA